MYAAPGARTCARARSLALASTFAVWACSSGPGIAGVPSEARRDDPGTIYENPRPAQPSRLMTPHKGIVLPHMHVRIVYIGEEGADGAPSYDSFVSWLVAGGDYWNLLRQYGVGYGVLDGSERVPTASFFTPGLLESGFVSTSDLDMRVYQFLRGRAGGDAGVHAGPSPGLNDVPNSVAYLFFLPNAVGVSSQGEQSCVVFDGYHLIDRGADPYVIIPSCGRNALAISHELAEMATDPAPLTGWYADSFGALGEIGDLCNFPVSEQIDFWKPTRLWSNADGDCEPH